MSSENHVGIMMAENLRFLGLGEGSSAQGKPGAKARPKGVVDAHTVEIPCSENYVGIIMAENLRFLGEGSSAQGKPGAKARPQGVVDAHTVEIP